MEQSDKQLVSGVIRQEQEAFSVLFQRHRAAVHSHLARIVRDATAADDLTQEVFLRLWHRAAQWKGQAAFRSWLLRIACAGDQLYDFIEQRLGRVPDGVELDEQLIRSLAPLDAWMRAFLAQSAQLLNGNNWLDRATHLRRLFIPDREQMFTPGHFGRTCPFETPEGPHIGRILTIARGAEVRDGALIVVDEDPVATLGLSASMVPFLEHDDGNRALMGTNMMRQWLPADEREPALVQTGLEPDADEFWCGRNLLTAYVSWDGYAFEDAVVISASCAAKEPQVNNFPLGMADSPGVWRTKWESY